MDANELSGLLVGTEGENEERAFVMISEVPDPSTLTTMRILAVRLPRTNKTWLLPTLSARIRGSFYFEM